MRLSSLLIPGDPGPSQAGDLLARSGLTHQLAPGLFSLLPLGRRMLHKLSAILRLQLEAAGAQEVAMPLLQPEALWTRPQLGGVSRAELFGSQLLRAQGADGTRWVLAPTHEETAAIVAAACVREARDLPRILYQIQPRFRDQPASLRAGLLRTREFVMGDAYSFDRDRSGLDRSYAALRDALLGFAARCGLEVELVAADAAAMGGTDSEELIAPLPRSTNAAALRCGACSYAASSEIAQREEAKAVPSSALPLQEVALSHQQAAAEAEPARRLVCLPFLAGARVVLAVLPADRALNRAKLERTLLRAGIAAPDLRAASAAELSRLGASYAWISLVDTPASILVVGDRTLQARANFCFPSPKTGHHFLNLNCGRDFRVDLFADLSAADEGAPCPRCGRALRAIHGSEVGHIFKLGASYSASFGACLSDGAPLQMGCYGVGLTRIMGALAEQRRDAHGPVWPINVAPHVASVSAAAAGQREVAERLYAELCAAGIDALLDDSEATPEHAGAQLRRLGIPLAVVVREDAGGRVVAELGERAGAERHALEPSAVLDALRDRVGRASRAPDH